MTESISNEINNANVSEAWKRKFALLEKLGADKQFILDAQTYSKSKELGFWDRQKISFNFWAFFFGCLYYFSKKMWTKGAFILGVVWAYATLLAIVELVFKFEIPAAIFWIPSSIICAQIANYDYYRKVIHGEKFWKGLPPLFSKPAGVLGFPLMTLAMLFTVFMFHPVPVPACHDKFLTDAVKRLIEPELGHPFNKSSKSTFTYSFNHIKTTFTDSETSANECEAKLSITASDSEYTEILSIKYIIEPSEKNGEFYIGLFDW